MRSVEKLERLVALAEKMGYRMRYEPLATTGGGVCEYGGNRWLFMDLDMSVEDRLGLITDALTSDPSLPVSELDDKLRAHFGFTNRQAA